MTIKLCAVVGCNDRTSKRHRFPKKDPEMLRIWVDATGNLKLKQIDVVKLYNNHVICERHFESKYMVPCGKKGRGLKKIAAPTLYLPEPKIQTESNLTNSTLASPQDECDQINYRPIEGKQSLLAVLTLPISCSSKESSVQSTLSNRERISDTQKVVQVRRSTIDEEKKVSVEQIVTSSTNNLQHEFEENDLERSFGNSLANVLKNIKGKKRRKRAMLEIFKKAVSYDRGSDTE